MDNSVSNFLDNLTRSLLDFLPKLGIAVAILIGGYLIGLLVERLVRRLILYLNHVINERLSQRLLNVDLRNSSLFISKTFFWVIMVIAIMISLEIFEIDIFSGWFAKIASYLPNILASVIIIFSGVILGRLAGDLVKSAASRTGLANGLYLGRVTRYLIIFVIVIVAIDQLGIDIQFLTNLVVIMVATLLLGGALAFALGARDSVSNILAAYYVKKTFKTGDRIKLDAVEGVIVRISDHSIQVESSDGLVVIPAKKFNQEAVIIQKDLS